MERAARPAVEDSSMKRRGRGFADGADVNAGDEAALCRTVFRNAFVYNKPGQPDGVRECAEKLSLVFEKEILKL